MRSSARLLLIASTLVLAGCGSGSSTQTSHGAASSAPAASATATSSAAAASAAGTSSAPVASASTTHVTIAGYAFHPATITVPVGAKITFSNHDRTAHTATSTTSRFDTGTVAPGATRTVVLRAPGRYAYYCQFHAFMRGIIVVR